MVRNIVRTAVANFLEISGKSGKVRDNRLNSYKNDLFSPLLRDFGNLKSVYFTPCFCLKSVLIDKI